MSISKLSTVVKFHVLLPRPNTALKLGSTAVTVSRDRVKQVMFTTVLDC